jgi:tetratricopeptide (TPR) repeat protein
MVQRELGHLDEALKMQQQSVDLYRELERASPRMFLSGLANALNSLGAVQSVLGPSASALDSAQEALDVIWPLFLETPEAHGDETEMLLHNLLNHLRAMGREPSQQLRERLEVFEARRGKKL